MMQSHTVAVFLKYPEPGTVKTRLAVDIGPAAAARIYRELVNMTLAALPWREATIEFHFTPSGAEPQARRWLTPAIPNGACPAFVPQADGDLGNRLNAAVERAFDSGHDTITLIGTDCPGLTSAHIRSAWMALGGHDAVFGPARDGGYYLLALKARAPYLFEDIPWSSGETLKESLRAAERGGLSTSLLETLRDIDTVADLTDTPWIPR